MSRAISWAAGFRSKTCKARGAREKASKTGGEEEVWPEELVDVTRVHHPDVVDEAGDDGPMLFEDLGEAGAEDLGGLPGEPCAQLASRSVVSSILLRRRKWTGGLVSGMWASIGGKA